MSLRYLSIYSAVLGIVFVFPLLMRGPGRRNAMVTIVMAIVFNTLNAVGNAAALHTRAVDAAFERNPCADRRGVRSIGIKAAGARRDPSQRARLDTS